ncbi:hypothetical protein FQN54_002826 [Arachnomyces sp. PD_36]|nr:hypothetical protein FQN54_002826 [Arachnomyces sp. PD_36]
MATNFQNFLESIGEKVDDFEEETFLLFSQEIPSQNLGFIDSKSSTVDVTIHGHDISIKQSPSVLTSTRAGGTTGAVLWKITPLIATWLTSKALNPLWASSILTPTSTVVELGCGISGLIPICLAPLVGHYIATDQEYVQRLVGENLAANEGVEVGAGAGVKTQGGKKGQQHGSKSRQGRKSAAAGQDRNSSSRGRKPTTNNPSSSGSGGGSGSGSSNITFIPLDWEHDDPSTLQSLIPKKSSPPPTQEESNRETDEEATGFPLLLACDCIYNTTLIPPLIRTIADLSRLRPPYQPTSTPNSSLPPTVSIVAQQLRSPDVFERWLREAMGCFYVWRVRDEVLIEGLREGRGTEGI